jgi:hypothetical protein
VHARTHTWNFSSHAPNFFCTSTFFILKEFNSFS